MKDSSAAATRPDLLSTPLAFMKLSIFATSSLSRDTLILVTPKQLTQLSIYITAGFLINGKEAGGVSALGEIEEMVLHYLKENPGSNPRKIADSLGLSLTKVRVALVRLKDRGLVVRTQRGYVAVAGSGPRYTAPSIPRREARSIDLASRIDALEKRITLIEARLKTLEERVKDISRILEKRVEAVPRPTRRSGRKELSEVLAERKVVLLDIARRHAFSKSIKEYLDSGDAVMVRRLIVNSRFFEEFKGRFPIPVAMLPKLSREEKMLLDAMVSEGRAYLHSGKEYRLTWP